MPSVVFVFVFNLITQNRKILLAIIIGHDIDNRMLRQKASQVARKKVAKRTITT